MAVPEEIQAADRINLDRIILNEMGMDSKFSNIIYKSLSIIYNIRKSVIPD